MRTRMRAAELVSSILVTSILAAAPRAGLAQEQSVKDGYQALVELFREWRVFERPPLRDGAPDYTAATFDRRHRELAALRARLRGIDPAKWPIAQQVDYRLVLAEMNGLDFYIRVLKPWTRDPAFYKSVYMEQSDTPAHEGPTHHAAIELWTYSFPLDVPSQGRLAAELRGIPPLLAQARSNLTGDAHDLWTTGTGTMRQQTKDLEDLDRRVPKAGAELKRAIRAGIAATNEFADWLDSQAPSRNGPSGIGKENYTWALRNVHLVPMTWEEEVTLLERELARAHASLRLEEHRNRALPQLPAAADADEYRRRAEDGVTRYMAFLKSQDILPMREYMDPALRAHLGKFQPEATRELLRHGDAPGADDALHTLLSLVRPGTDARGAASEPDPSRRPALQHLGQPRRGHGDRHGRNDAARRPVRRQSARPGDRLDPARATRGTRTGFAVRAQANEFTLKQAKDFQVKWTPRGWMRPDLDLVGFEQQLYLRQPGYGTSYVTGKYLLERLLTDRASQLGDAFTLRRWFDEVNGAGVIPVELIRWELTGIGDELPAVD